MDLRKKYQDACEKLRWSLTDEGDGEVVISMSVGDKDYYFNASVNCMAESVREIYNNFDVDEQVKMALDCHPSLGIINNMLDEVAEARGLGESGADLRWVLVADDEMAKKYGAKDISDKLLEVTKEHSDGVVIDAQVIDEVDGLLDWLRELRSDAQRIKDDLKELADTLEGTEREQVDIKLTAYTNPAADIRPEGATLELADGREVYADFLGCDTERSSIDWEYGTAEYLLEDVTFRDEKGGEEILLSAEELRDAELKAVHVRCDREEGLYFEAESVDITAWDADNRRVQLMHDNSNSTLGHVDVHAADHWGNGWHVADHKVERKPSLDDLIRGAQDRAAAEGPGKERTAPELEH